MNEAGLGTHYLADFYQCHNSILNNKPELRKVLLEAARIAKATIVNEVFHEFSPHGLSGVIVIAESHLSIHTWPEHNYAAVDLFTCSADMLPLEGLDFIKQKLGSQRVQIQKISRGKIPSS